MLSYFRGIFLALQLEGYDISRFLHTIYQQGFLKKKDYRQEIVWTKKMYTLVSVSILLFIVLFAIGYRYSLSLQGIRFALSLFIIFVVLVLGFPFCVVGANIVIKPLDRLLKHYLIQSAIKKLARYPSIKVIAITGSYGKTSLKHILQHVYSTEKKVVITPESYNTPMGVAKTILDMDLKNCDILVIEMGAYHIGDIAKLCEITKPSLGILTGITAQHLERFGSLENIAHAKRELGSYVLNHGGKMYVNMMREETKKYLHPLLPLPHDSLIILEKIGKIDFLENFSGISFTLDNHICKTPLLARYHAEYCWFAYHIGKELGISPENLIKSIANIPYIKHRLEPLFNKQTGVTIIDDSFNGNIAGVESTIDLIRGQTIRGKKVYLTPGLVELGDDSEKVHKQLAKKLASTFDIFLLIETTGSMFLKQGLEENGISTEQIHLFPHASQAHASLGKFLQKGDCIVFQNDTTDNYS